MPNDENEFAELNIRFDSAIKTDAKTEREKLSIFAEGWQLIHQLGGPACANVGILCVEKGVKLDTNNDYWGPAQLVTGMVVASMNSVKSKKDARNYATRAVFAFRGLDLNQEQFLEADVDTIVDWMELEGGINGIKKLLAGDKTEAGEEEDELFDAGALTEVLLRDGLSFNAPVGALEPEVGLSLHYRDGDVTPAFHPAATRD